MNTYNDDDDDHDSVHDDGKWVDEDRSCGFEHALEGDLKHYFSLSFSIEPNDHTGVAD